jgi:hypothetical protein
MQRLIDPVFISMATNWTKFTNGANERHRRGRLAGLAEAVRAGIVAMVKAASGGALQSGGVGRRGKV